MSREGARIIRSLKSFIKDVEAGKPVRQSIVRRVWVKGKPVYCHENYTAPLKPMGKKPT